jgi:ribonuclease P protein component
VAVQHVLTKSHFDAAMNSAKGAKVLGKTQHFCLHAGLSTDAPHVHALLVGVVLPKRWAKSAVRRNLLRRAIYRQAPSLSPFVPTCAAANALLVVRLTSGFAPSAFKSARSEVLQQAVRAELQTLFASAQSAFERFIGSSPLLSQTTPVKS